MTSAPDYGRQTADDRPTLDDVGGDALAATAEWCPRCEREQTHRVHIDLVSERPDGESAGAKFAREPYRTAICTHCGSERTRRMNDA